MLPRVAVFVSSARRHRCYRNRRRRALPRQRDPETLVRARAYNAKPAGHCPAYGQKCLVCRVIFAGAGGAGGQKPVKRGTKENISSKHTHTRSLNTRWLLFVVSYKNVWRQKGRLITLFERIKSKSNERRVGDIYILCLPIKYLRERHLCWCCWIIFVCFTLYTYTPINVKMCNNLFTIISCTFM